MSSTRPVAIVTGSSSGIGLCTARHLARNGYHVYGCARRTHAAPHEPFISVQLDVTDDAGLVALIARVVREQGRIDVLVNNAGFSLWGAVEDTPPAEARRQFDVNLFAVGRLCQLVLPYMRERGQGRIINMSSASGEVWTPLSAWYTASKYALEGFSNALRVEAAPWGVDVVVVQPALTRSEGPALAADMVQRISGRGAYAPWAERSAKGLRDQQAAEERWDDPQLVADAVLAAATAKRPLTRYPVGWAAWGVLAFKRWVPDRVYDMVALKAFGCENGQLARRGAE